MVNHGTVEQVTKFGLRFLQELNEAYDYISKESKPVKKVERTFFSTNIDGKEYHIGMVVKLPAPEAPK